MIHNGKQVFHHLRGTVLFDPVLHKALQKLCPYVSVVVKETTFNDIPYAILLLEIPKLATEHLVVGKDVIAFSDRKPVAGSYQQASARTMAWAACCISFMTFMLRVSNRYRSCNLLPR